MDLTEIRQEIDGIDQELVRLFCARMNLSAQVADYKRQIILPHFRPARSEPFSRMWHRWQGRKWKTTPGCSTPCFSS